MADQRCDFLYARPVPHTANEARYNGNAGQEPRI